MHVAALGILVVATAVSAANIAVSVGANNGLTFSPNNVMAAAGDVITFTFQTSNHSVTQSTFAQPCVMSGTIDSGFMAVTSAMLPTFSITVQDTNPLWFHCAQTIPASHCKIGMVFAVNPTAAETFAQFQTNAENGGSPTSAATTTESVSSTGTTAASASGTSTTTESAPSSTTAGSAPGTSTTTGSTPSPTTTGSASGTGTTTKSAAPSSTTNSAVGVNSNFAGLLTLAGLVAGLAL